MTCQDCGSKMTIEKTAHFSKATLRVEQCACGSRFETEEKVIRRLPAAVRRPPAPAGNAPAGGTPPPATVANPPATDGGVGGGLPSDLSGSGPIPSGASLSPDQGVDPARMSKPGSYLTERFKIVRAEYCGGMKWQSVRSHDTAAAMAAEIGDDAESLADVIPTMRLMFEKARAGRLDKHQDILKDPSFAFGTWCSKFTALRGELHSAGPSNGFARSEYPEVRR